MRKALMVCGVCCAAVVLVAAVLPWWKRHRLKEAHAKWQANRRCLSIAIIQYPVDHGGIPTRLEHLTTPIPYLSSSTAREKGGWMDDPFASGRPLAWFVADRGRTLVLASVGADRVLDESLYGDDMLDRPERLVDGCYDPTNGIPSAGDCFLLFVEEDDARTSRVQRLREAWPTYGPLAWHVVKRREE